MRHSDEQFDADRSLCGVDGDAFAAAPAWITPELLELTVRVWQPYYAMPLSRDDAIGIIQSVGRLIGVLSRS